jgi:hypothetical protein
MSSILVYMFHIMMNIEKMILSFLAHEVSITRVGLPILTSVLALQIYGLTQGVIIL